MRTSETFVRGNIAPVFNLHFLEECNYDCRYCYAVRGCAKKVTFDEAKHIVEKIAGYCKTHGVKCRINLAGGEPLLCPFLDGLIDYIHAKGIDVSIITNGSLLTEDRIASWKGKVCCIGISADSVNPETLKKLGGCDCRGMTLTKERLEELARAVHEAGIRLKLNTVVTRANLAEAEELSAFFRALRPERMKLLKMQIVKGVNEDAEALSVSEEEFSLFCDAFDFDGVVREDDMSESYLMIDPSGKFFMNVGGKYVQFGDLLSEYAETVMKRALPSFDSQRYRSRYGSGARSVQVFGHLQDGNGKIQRGDETL